LSAKFDEAASLDFLFSGTGAEIKRATVRHVLLTERRNIEHAAVVMRKAAILQEDSAVQGLAHFLSTTPDRLKVLIPIAAKVSKLANYLAELLVPSAGGQLSDKLPLFIGAIARAIVLFDRLGFTVPEIRAVTEMPRAFNITDTPRFAFNDIVSLFYVQTFGARIRRSNRWLDRLFQAPDS
jgi:hypothetical protein